MMMTTRRPEFAQQAVPTCLVTRIDLGHVLLAIETFEAEIEQLVYDKEWYSDDSLDLLASSKQLLHSILGIEEHYEEEGEDDYENCQSSFELRNDS